jgi:DNA ligase 1
MSGAGETLQLARVLVTDDARELRPFLLASVEGGLEGVVATRIDTPYRAGGRNFDWVKLKRNVESGLLDTIDWVILG